MLNDRAWAPLVSASDYVRPLTEMDRLMLDLEAAQLPDPGLDAFVPGLRRSLWEGDEGNWNA